MKDALNDAAWLDILAYVRTRYGAATRGWFGQLRAGPLAGGELTVLAADEAQVSYLTEYCVRPFVEAAQAVTGRLVSVQFAFNREGQPCYGPDREEAQSSQRLSFESDSAVLRLNPEHSFENFVTGPCNQLAQASCLAVSKSPGRVYNPLFVHGRSGLGKTHLLQAVCSKTLDDAPATKVIYISCETYVNHFIEAVEKGALSSFRYRYRYADILVIDDIQFLAKGERIQEEFFHTFNALAQFQKQIILSADSLPVEIPNLEERLVSRFNGGLVARVDPPCLETRLAILSKKAKAKGMTLPEDVALFIASRITSNTRELEGALTSLQGQADVLGWPTVTVSLAKQMLGGDEAAPARQIRVQDIINVVTDRFGVRLSDVQGRRRSKSIAFPRQVCMFLAREMTDHSLEEIGGFFGGRDHTTVLHAHRLVSQRREEDLELRSKLEEIVRSLRTG